MKTWRGAGDSDRSRSMRPSSTARSAAGAAGRAPPARLGLRISAGVASAGRAARERAQHAPARERLGAARAPRPGLRARLRPRAECPRTWRRATGFFASLQSRAVYATLAIDASKPAP
jgi:hypothetical protein